MTTRKATNKVSKVQAKKNASRNKLDAQLVTLTARVDECERIVQQNDRFVTQVIENASSMRTEFDTLQNKYLGLLQLQDGIRNRLDKLESRFDSFSGNVRETSNVSTYYQLLDDYNVQYSEYESLKQENHNLREQLESCHDEIDTLSSNFCNVNEMRKALELQLQTLAECIVDQLEIVSDVDNSLSL